MYLHNGVAFRSYILFVPFETEDQAESGIVYVWIGAKSNEEDTKLIQEIAEDMFNNPWVSLQVRIVINIAIAICNDTLIFYRVRS